jgi:flagellar hook assembly protein FlgD
MIRKATSRNAIAYGQLFVGAFGKVVTFENYGTGIDPISRGPKKSPELFQNWPNPFEQTTSFQFTLDQPDYLNISVYDLSGKKVKIISAHKFESGIHTLSWDGTNDRSPKVPAGIYILKLTNKIYVRS